MFVTNEMRFTDRPLLYLTLLWWCSELRQWVVSHMLETVELITVISTYLTTLQSRCGSFLVCSHWYQQQISLRFLSPRHRIWVLPLYCQVMNIYICQGYTVFSFVCLCVCLCICVHSVPLVWMGGMTYCTPRNVCDSCAKSWLYFRTDKILLETSFYWLSDDVVRFKIEVGVYKKCTKM